MLHYLKKIMYPVDLIMDDLVKNTLFTDIKRDAVRDLFNHIDFNVRKFEDEDIIINQGSKYDSLYILLQGSFYGEMMGVTGKSVLIGVFSAPYSISCGILFSDENLIPSTLRSRKKSKFAIIGKNHILKMCLRNEQFLKNFLNAVSNTSSFLAKKLYYMKFETIREKLIQYLISESKGRNSLELSMTVENLAAFFGVERQSLSRVFREFEEKGLIKKNKREIMLIDRDKLLSML